MAPSSPSRILQPRLEPNIDLHATSNQTNVILLDDNDDQNYVDANGDEENEVPKVVVKKKGKKKKQQQQQEQEPKAMEIDPDASIQLNTSSNRTSTAGHKYPVRTAVPLSFSHFIERFISLVAAKTLVEMVGWQAYLRHWRWQDKCCS